MVTVDCKAFIIVSSVLHCDFKLTFYVGGVVEPACWLPVDIVTQSGHCPALLVHQQHVHRQT